MGEPRGHHGRVVGTPNRDKSELRALIQERVHEFTEMRRAEDIRANMAEGMSKEEAEEKAQRIFEDYDPVVQMSLVAVDRRSTLDQQHRANAEVAQYVRPKLKSVEVTTDPEALETLAERQELSSRLVGLLEMAAEAKHKRPPAPEDNEL